MSEISKHPATHGCLTATIKSYDTFAATAARYFLCNRETSLSLMPFCLHFLETLLRYYQYLSVWPLNPLHQCVIWLMVENLSTLVIVFHPISVVLNRLLRILYKVSSRVQFFHPSCIIVFFGPSLFFFLLNLLSVVPLFSCVYCITISTAH